MRFSLRRFFSRSFQVMEAEQARTCSEAEHKKTAANYNSCIGHMRQLEKKLKRSINKSRFVIGFWEMLLISSPPPEPFMRACWVFLPLLDRLAVKIDRKQRRQRVRRHTEKGRRSDSSPGRCTLTMVQVVACSPTELKWRSRSGGSEISVT